MTGRQAVDLLRQAGWTATMGFEGPEFVPPFRPGWMEGWIEEWLAELLLIHVKASERLAAEIHGELSEEAAGSAYLAQRQAARRP